MPKVLSASSIDEKSHVLSSGIYSYFTDRYGTRSSMSRGRTRKHKKAHTSLDDIRAERNRVRNDLRRAKKQSQDIESIRALATKFHLLLRQYKQISRAEKRVTTMKSAQKERRDCAKNVCKFAKDGKHQQDTEPAFDMASAHDYFKTAYSSEGKEFNQPHWLPNAQPPTYPFDESPFTMGELEGVIKRVRTGAAPSPLDQITYLVLRRCPSLALELLDLFNLCWEQRRVPQLWKQGVIRLIPKAAAEEEPHTPANVWGSYIQPLSNLCEKMLATSRIGGSNS